MLDLGVTEGAVESFAMGVNASGQVGLHAFPDQRQIVANSGNSRAYLLTPMQAAPAVTMLLLQ